MEKEILFWAITLILVILAALIFVGIDKVSEARLKVVDAIFVYQFANMGEKIEVAFSDIYKWKLIDCLNPSKWEPEVWLPKDKLKIIKEFIR